MARAHDLDAGRGEIHLLPEFHPLHHTCLLCNKTLIYRTPAVPYHIPPTPHTRPIIKTSNGHLTWAPMAALFNEGDDDEPAGLGEAVFTAGTPVAADRNTEPGFTTNAVIAAGAHRASIERIAGAILFHRQCCCSRRCVGL